MIKRYTSERDLIAELADEAARSPELERVVLSGVPRESELRRIEIRPVAIQGQRLLSVRRYDSARCTTANIGEDQLAGVFTEALGFKNLTAQTAQQRTDARLTRRGRTLVTVVDEGRSPTLQHDRQKLTLLEPNAPFLEALGLAKGGVIKPSQQKKWRQVNEFLRLLVSNPAYERVLQEGQARVVDLGSGNAYLTFAAYHYLSEVVGIDCQMVGVDRDAAAVQRGNERSRALGWEKLEFLCASIGEAVIPWEPNILVSLHACDTASDDAIARALEWGVQVVLIAPCCHHDLQRQLTKSHPEQWRGLLHHPVLRERLGDLLTDAFRAELLAQQGYRTDVVQFVSPEHSGKNLMVRGWRDDNVSRGERAQVYQRLRDEWGVEPYLERLLRQAPGARGSDA